MAGEDLPNHYNRTREAANALHAQALEIRELTKRFETLTKDTPAWGTPPRGLEWRRGLPWSKRRNCGGCSRSWQSGWPRVEHIYRSVGLPVPKEAHHVLLDNYSAACQWFASDPNLKIGPKFQGPQPYHHAARRAR